MTKLQEYLTEHGWGSVETLWSKPTTDVGSPTHKMAMELVDALRDYIKTEWPSRQIDCAKNSGKWEELRDEFKHKAEVYRLLAEYCEAKHMSRWAAQNGKPLLASALDARCEAIQRELPDWINK